MITKNVVPLQCKYDGMRKILFFIVIFALCCSCAKLEQVRMRGVLVECNGKTLTQNEISALTFGLSPEDSAKLAEQYIYQWAVNLLMEDVIKNYGDKNIERLVADYRRSLYQHEWERRMIERGMSQVVDDSLVMWYYENNKKHFVLDETILSGVLLVVPLGAPDIEQLKKYMADPTTEENLERIEKYAYQYASGYELFLEDWKTASQVLVRMPIDEDYLQKQLKRSRQVAVQDTLNTYLLQVTDLYNKGDLMPMQYARKEIEKIVLSQRQVEFIQNKREALYNDAIESGKLKRYEN